MGTGLFARSFIFVPHHHKGACPLCGGFRQKEAAPLTEAASSKSIYWRPSRPNENIAVAPATPFPRATLAKRVSGRERVAPGRQLSALLGSGLELVVVDQAAGLDDGTLFGRHIGNIELNLLDRAIGTHHVGGDILQVAIE